MESLFADLGDGDRADFHVVMEGLTFCAVIAILVVEWRRSHWLSLSLEKASSHSQRLSGQFWPSQA